VWFDPNAITNVLSFAMALFWVKYDNAVADMFYVETPKGMLPFAQLTMFLYVFKPSELENLKTIKHLAVHLMQIWKRYWEWMESKMVVQDDIVLAEKIYGKDIAIFKGKTVQNKPKPVVHDIVHIPSELKNWHNKCFLVYWHILC
jgi:hypothetical protein